MAAVDMLIFGDKASEEDHEFTGDKTATGVRHGKKWIRTIGEVSL